MKIGSLFSGIGGLELGLEAAGLGETVWQVEKNEYARRVLAKHWPGAKRFDDVRTVGAANLERVSILAGGFPCTDTSVSGQVVRNQAGLAGEHSGLWREMLRVCSELLPQFIIVENPTGLLTNANGIGTVLGGLASIREPGVCRVVTGVPHRVDRVRCLGNAVTPAVGYQVGLALKKMIQETASPAAA